MRDSMRDEETRDTLGQLAESAGRVHFLAREGLGLPQLDYLGLRTAWRSVAARFLDQPDGDYRVEELAIAAISHYAMTSELSPQDPAFAEDTLPAWEAVARHLTQWVNELEEGSLKGIEGSEEAWKEWARLRGTRVMQGA